MILCISRKYARDRETTVQLFARWSNNRVVVADMDRQIFESHLIPEQIMGGVAGCPTIDRIEVGRGGIGCVIAGSNAAGAPFVVEAPVADFLKGEHLAFYPRVERKY